MWVKSGGREWYIGEGEKRKTKVSINGRGLNVMCEDEKRGREDPGRNYVDFVLFSSKVE